MAWKEEEQLQALCNCCFVKPTEGKEDNCIYCQDMEVQAGKKKHVEIKLMTKQG